MPNCLKCPAFPCHWNYHTNAEELCSPEDRRLTKSVYERLNALEKKVKKLAAMVAERKE